MTTDPIVIVGMSRTPMGGFMGELSSVPATELGAIAIAGALENAKISGDDVDEVLMGCVLPAGLGQAPARQAALGAGLPKFVPCSTVNKVCGSGMKTVMMAHDSITAGSSDISIVGGMESMSQAPHMLPAGRTGIRLGHGKVLDHMMLDGLEDAYENRAMGTFAEETAQSYQFTREQQDAYAIESLRRANEAIANDHFAGEITPVTVKTRKGDILVERDEQPGKAMPEKIPGLRPAFAKDGTITAANASSISDGAAALVLMRASAAKEKGLTVLATIKGHSMNAQAPKDFTTAPVGAIEKLMAKVGWNVADVDLFEVNEAFAMVAMIAMQELNIPHEKVNVNGGACALGHPIGASGARIIVTLINALNKRGLKKGVATLCIGGGEATAIALEVA